MNDHAGSLLDRALGVAAVILLIALMLHWAWLLLAPLVPVILAVGAVAGVVTVLVSVTRERW